MTICWTDAAIEAAHKMLPNKRLIGRKDVRPALDAAVATQGMTAGWINRAVDDAYQEGRADALEEAASIVSVVPWTGDVFGMQRKIAAAIRALKEKKG